LLNETVMVLAPSIGHALGSRTARETLEVHAFCRKRNTNRKWRRLPPVRRPMLR
jgi:hypothetical protein